MSEELDIFGHDGLDIFKVKLDAHTLNPMEQFVVGQVLSPLFRMTTGNMVIAQYVLYATLICVPRDMTFDNVGIDVKVLESGYDARLGLYSVSAALYPDALQNDFGTVDTDSAAFKSIALSPSVSVTKGYYYTALITDATGTAEVIKTRSYGHGLGTRAASFSYASTGYAKTATATEFAALPATFPAAGTITIDMPMVGLRLESLD